MDLSYKNQKINKSKNKNQRIKKSRQVVYKKPFEN
jgi:hypothetical protein